MSERPWRNKETLYRMYVEQGKPTTQIADELGCAVSTVSKYMNRYDIPIESRNYRTDVDFRDPERLRELYWEAEMTIGEVADELGISNTTVKKWMNEHGIKRRDPQKASAAKRSVNRATFVQGEDGYEFWAARNADGIDYVYVHRLTAVAQHGFEAVCGKQVHHKTNIPWDNRPSNLQPVTQAEHSKIHAGSEVFDDAV